MLGEFGFKVLWVSVYCAFKEHPVRIFGPPGPLKLGAPNPVLAAARRVLSCSLDLVQLLQVVHGELIDRFCVICFCDSFQSPCI